MMLKMREEALAKKAAVEKAKEEAAKAEADAAANPGSKPSRLGPQW